MSFVVPLIEPARATGLAAGDTIEAVSMEDLLLRDRFLFATRRRLIASLPKVTTTASGAYQTAYGFYAKTLPTSTGTLIFGFVTTNDASVRVTAGASTATVTTGAAYSRIGVVTGVPINTWFSVLVEVKSNTGAPLTIKGIYIAEIVLEAADLP
jgi:hypothetical protein